MTGTVALTIGLMNAQSSAQSSDVRPEFEVASIKPNSSGSTNMGAFAQPGGRFGAQNVPLRYLIQAAYDVKSFQIVFAGSSRAGLPWIDADRYDLTAKAPQGTANGFEPLRPMLQSLLADRFKLAIHRETRELPVFDLVTAKGGLKLAAAKDGNCGVPDPQNPRPRELAPLCNNIKIGRGVIEASGIAMPRLIAALSDVLGRRVIDKTGFTGVFDCRLEFAVDEAIADVIAGGVTRDSTQPIDAHPSIFTALTQQPGLKAEPAKGPVQVIVIDHADPPTAN
jgi:uncharacterized protein (TIGR03435 family)